MIRVALIVALSGGVRVIKQSDGAQLVPDGDNGPADDFAYLGDLVALGKPVVDALKLRVAA